MYLRQDFPGVAEGGANGYALNLSGALSFDNRFLFAFSMLGAAGEMRTTGTALRDPIPWQSRISASYIHAIHEEVEIHRADPSGLPSDKESIPSAYVMGIAEARLTEFDSTVASIAVETVPVHTIPFGLRAGWNSNGDLSGGAFFSIATEFTRDLRLNLALRRDAELGELTQHVSVSFGW
jgi:hypothetical protein